MKSHEGARISFVLRVSSCPFVTLRGSKFPTPTSEIAIIEKPEVDQRRSHTRFEDLDAYPVRGDGREAQQSFVADNGRLCDRPPLAVDFGGQPEAFDALADSDLFLQHGDVERPLTQQLQLDQSFFLAVRGFPIAPLRPIHNAIH